jgi:hypothetical protein
MRGLSHTNPDFNDYCKELFMVICQNTASYNSNITESSKKSNKVTESSKTERERIRNKV